MVSSRFAKPYSDTRTTEVAMRKLLILGLAGLFLVLTGCQDTNMTGPLTGPTFHKKGKGASHGSLSISSFAMVDGFAVEITGASGSGKIRLRHRSVRIKVKAKDLLPNTVYELNVTIDFASFVTFTATSNKKGKIKFKGDLEFAPGEYRLDFFVTHDEPTISEAKFDFLVPLFLLLDRDLLLRCLPATIVSIL